MGDDTVAAADCVTMTTTTTIESINISNISLVQQISNIDNNTFTLFKFRNKINKKVQLSTDEIYLHVNVYIKLQRRTLVYMYLKVLKTNNITVF